MELIDWLDHGGDVGWYTVTSALVATASLPAATMLAATSALVVCLSCQEPISQSFLGTFCSYVLCIGPNAQVSEEFRQGGGLVVSVEATGVGKDPSVAATEKGLLQADAGVFVA